MRDGSVQAQRRVAFEYFSLFGKFWQQNCLVLICKPLGTLAWLG
jgi:hypothetical protein